MTKHSKVSPFEHLSSNRKKMSCCKKSSLILGFIFLEVSDLVFDWDFFYEVTTTEQEIIKNDEGIRYSILVFAVIGTILFIYECRNLVKKLNGDVHFRNPHVVSAFHMFIEDFPQVVLALIVAYKEDEVLNWVQYAKAVFAIVEASIRLSVSIYIACQGKGDDKDDMACSNCAQIIQGIGCFFILSVCVIIFLMLLGFL